MATTTLLPLNGQRRRNPIYTPGNVPEGLVTLAEAEEATGAHRRRINSWVQRGRLRERGRLRGRAPGGGFILVALADVLCILREMR